MGPGYFLGFPALFYQIPLTSALLPLFCSLIEEYRKYSFSFHYLKYLYYLLLFSPATPHLILRATVKIFFKHIAGLIYDHTARLLAISIILLTLSINSVLFVSGSQLILTELSMSSTGIPIASST